MLSNTLIASLYGGGGQAPAPSTSDSKPSVGETPILEFGVMFYNQYFYVVVSDRVSFVEEIEVFNHLPYLPNASARAG